MSLRAFSLMICLSGCAGGEAEEGPPQRRPIGEESDADADSDADSDADADTDAPEGLAIVGDWSDIYGITHEISETRWTMVLEAFPDTQHEIVAYDNDLGALVAQNGATNPNYPGLWSRFEWVWEAEGGFWFCQTRIDAATEAEAAATAAANRADPASGGCLGNPWDLASPL